MIREMSNVELFKFCETIPKEWQSIALVDLIDSESS